MNKKKVAFYWAGSCGGCEISITELGMKLIDFAEQVEILFWPCILDFKYADVKALQDQEIDICFFNGAICSHENEAIAHLLRRKSKTVVAFGACANGGGIPGLLNLSDSEAMLQRVFCTVPSLDETRGTLPQVLSSMPEGEIEIPALCRQVKTLPQVVAVDYFMPGCPPVAEQVGRIFDQLLKGELPAAPAVIGVDEKTLCDVCPRIKGNTPVRIIEFKRPHEVLLDQDVCFLTQGVICCGPVTRAGCGLPCLNANMPCRGCYGAPEGVTDQGAKLVSAIAPLIDTSDPEQVQKTLDSIVDPVGTFYRFSLADSFLNELKQNGSTSR